MPNQIYSVDFKQYRFLLHFRPNLDLTPVIVSSPPTKDQCFQVFARMLQIIPARNADGTMRGNWSNMTDYVQTIRRLTLDLIRQSVHDRPIDEIL